MKLFSSGNACVYCWESTLENTLSLSNNIDAEVIPFLETCPQETLAMCTRRQLQKCSQMQF